VTEDELAAEAVAAAGAMVHAATEVAAGVYTPLLYGSAEATPATAATIDA